jgi:hypothetical protein
LTGHSSGDVVRSDAWRVHADKENHAVKTLRLCAVATLVIIPAVTHAGVYTDDMTKCLVESTSKEDRLSLVRWMFAAMSQHPAVTSLTNVKDSDVEKANSETGALFMRLLTESCVEATKKAIRYEGPAAIQLSFQVLGQVASSELFADPGVLKVMSGLEKYTDQQKLEALAK